MENVKFLPGRHRLVFDEFGKVQMRDGMLLIADNEDHGSVTLHPMTEDTLEFFGLKGDLVDTPAPPSPRTQNEEPSTSRPDSPEASALSQDHTDEIPVDTPAPPSPRTQNQAPSTSRPDSPEASALTQEHTDEIPDGFRWVHESIMMLLSTYSELKENFESGQMSNKKMWDQISLELTARGHIITAGQCQSKFKSMKKRYKNVIDHNKKSGNDRKSWPYFQVKQIMDDMFKNSPWVKPVSVVDSSSFCPSPSPRASTSEKRPYKRARNDDAIADELKAIREQKERIHREHVELQTQILREIQRLNNSSSRPAPQGNPEDE